MTTCWENHDNSVGKVTVSIPCGATNATDPNVACCVQGDICMSDGICHYTHSLEGGTGYYVADCTDDTFDSANCRRACSDNPSADIVYDSDLGVWKCCAYNDGGTADCVSPTNENFAAPAPSKLVTVQVLPASGTPIYATSTAAGTSSVAFTSASSIAAASTSGTTSSLTSSESRLDSGELSSGAKVGIGIGVALAVLLLIGLLTLLILRKRRREGVWRNARDDMTATAVGGDKNSTMIYAKERHPTEMYGLETLESLTRHGTVHELHVPLAELDGNQARGLR